MCERKMGGGIIKMHFEEDMLDEFSRLIRFILAFNTEGRIIYASAGSKEIFQYGDSIKGMKLRALFPGLIIDDKDISDIEEKINNIRYEEGYINAYRKNGTCFPVMLRMIKTEEDIYILRIINMHRETEWKNRLERADIESKAVISKQNEFVANVTHELRTPVNGIKGHVTFLREQDNLTGKQQETLDIIVRCCRNMEKIINDLLDFAKIDAGKMTIEKEMFNFREMMEQVRATNIKQANQKGISLYVEVDDMIPDNLYGDSLRIGQILNNFISNAVKFTSVGYVRVEVVESSRTGNSIELFFMVIDTGIGIAKENLDKLFKSFSQVDGSITRTYGGTGLGLAISKQLVQMMNGSIRVESEYGKGSTFAFSVVLGLRDDFEEEIEEIEEKEDEVVSNDNRTEALQSRFDQIINKVQRDNIENVFQWGSEENRTEIKDTLGKLVLCIEMDNWEKAEMFLDKVKKLTDSADMDVKKQLFKLQMAVRKGNYEQAITEYNVFLSIVNGE